MKALVPDLAIVPRLLTRSALVTFKRGASQLPVRLPKTQLRPSRGLTSDSRIADGEGLASDIGGDADEELLLGFELGGVGEGGVADLKAEPREG